MVRSLAVPGHPVQDLGVALHRRSRGNLATVERVKRGLVENVARGVDGFHPLAPILRGGQVVEAQRGMDRGIDAAQLDRAARVRVHGADVDLVAVAAGGRRAVVADGHGQEVEHEIGIGHFVIAANETARLEVVGRGRALVQEKPLEADPRLVVPAQRGEDRDRLGAGVLDVDLQMILHILAHAGQVLDHGNVQRLQVGGRAHAGQLQQLGRVDRAAAADHPPGADRLRAPAPACDFHAHRACAVEENARDQHLGAQVEIGTVHDRVQIRTRRAQPSPAMHVAVEGGKAFLTIAVDVVGERVARFLHGGEECVEKRTGRGAAFQHQGTVVAAKVVAAGQTRLHALEVGQAVGVVPCRHAGVGGPACVVQRIAALEDHAVDAAGAAQHLAAPVKDAPVVHVWLRLGCVAPVVARVADGHGQPRGHVDEDVPQVVAAPGLQHQHALVRVRAQAVGQHAARRAAADDDGVVVVWICHWQSALLPCDVAC